MIETVIAVLIRGWWQVRVISEKCHKEDYHPRMQETEPSPADQSEFLLGRLFIVPSIIVAVIILCAVVVVLSFGAITSSKEMPISKVLAVLEAGPVNDSAGLMVTPREKEMWQAAQELALRLENVDAEVSADELPDLQRRLANLLQRDLHAEGQTNQTRVVFIMHAAAKSKSVEAVPVLVEALKSPKIAFRREALAALSQMSAMDEARAQAMVVVGMLEDPEPVVRMLACVTLTHLADPTDPLVIAALASTHLADGDRDVRWNAALTLARMGSTKAFPTIVDLLQRSFWEQQRVQYQSQAGPAIDRPMTPSRMSDYLITAIDAASKLDDNIVWSHIEILRDDPVLKVSASAERALAERSTHTEEKLEMSGESN